MLNWMHWEVQLIEEQGDYGIGLYAATRAFVYAL